MHLRLADITTGHAKAFTNPDWLFKVGGACSCSYVAVCVQGDRNGFNSPDVYRLEIPAANGICTARGLAQAFNGVVMGKVCRLVT